MGAEWSAMSGQGCTQQNVLLGTNTGARGMNAQTQAWGHSHVRICLYGEQSTEEEQEWPSDQ